MTDSENSTQKAEESPKKRFGSMSKRKRKNIVFVGLMVLVVALTAIPGEKTACVVTGKTLEEGYKRRGLVNTIHTENCGTFHASGDWFVGQFSSSEVYNDLEVGEAYNFKTRGFRFLVAYPNILSFEKL